MEAKEIDEVVGRARARLANANWDASKHPRGAGGRFGKGAGGEKDESEIDLDEYSRRSAASDHTRRSVKLDELDKKKASAKKPYWADSIQRAREALAKRNAAKKEQSAKNQTAKASEHKSDKPQDLSKKYAGWESDKAPKKPYPEPKGDYSDEKQAVYNAFGKVEEAARQGKIDDAIEVYRQLRASHAARRLIDSRVEGRDDVTWGQMRTVINHSIKGGRWNYGEEPWRK